MSFIESGEVTENRPNRLERRPVPPVVERLFRARSQMMMHGLTRPEAILTLHLHTVTANEIATIVFRGPWYPIIQSGDKLFGFTLALDDEMEPGTMTLRYEVTV